MVNAHQLLKYLYLRWVAESKGSCGTVELLYIGALCDLVIKAQDDWCNVGGFRVAMAVLRSCHLF